MKVLLCILLVAISCQVIVCDDTKIVKMINTAVPKIIEEGIAEGKLPGGPYYLHHVIKSSIGAQDSHFTLDVRQLDNQTVVTVKATIDNTDLSVKTSCFTAKIGENIMALTQGWQFFWMYYAPYGQDGEYCFFGGEWETWPSVIYGVRPDQLTSDNVIKLAYDGLQEAKNGEWKTELFDGYLDPKFGGPGPYRLEVGWDFVSVFQYAGRESWGEYDYTIYNEYIPCTGQQSSYYHVSSAPYT